MKYIVWVLVLSSFLSFSIMPVGAMPADAVLVSCFAQATHYSLTVTSDTKGDLLLRSRGYNGDRILVVERDLDGFNSPEQFKGTVDEVSFTRKPDGRYYVFFAGGFGGGYDFAPDECVFH
jgi:hypothetical protein